MAHKIDTKPRTGDVIINENLDFAGLLLSDSVQQGLKQAGFERPSPIQLKAIPLGRCGLDLIVQAKSGTGKTLVFVIIALESILLESTGTQVIVLAPTREIAVQIWEVFKMIGFHMPALRCYTFIGGLPVSEDRQKLKKCHIAVGTPGRLKQLIEEQVLHTESVRLFILDEADKLMESGFQGQINWIYSTLPENKQMLALSATYPEILAQHLTAYMRNPTFVRLNTSDPALLGIRQYYKKVKFHPLAQKAFENKIEALLELLSSVAFHQCLVFSNYQLRAQSLSDQLNAKGWPSTYISGSQDQMHRLKAMAKLKAMHCRVLISTDLTARGIDVEHVNLVVNLDVPRDHETYLHRIGRAGRFGTYGAGITLTSEGKEFQELRIIEDKCNTHILPLPDPIPNDLAKASGYVNLDDLVSTEQLYTNQSALIDLYAKSSSLEKQDSAEITGDNRSLILPDPKVPVENAESPVELYPILSDSKHMQEFVRNDNLTGYFVDPPKKLSPRMASGGGLLPHSRAGARVRRSSPPTDSSSMNDNTDKRSPRPKRRQRKTRGKGSPLQESNKENRLECHYQAENDVFSDNAHEVIPVANGGNLYNGTLDSKDTKVSLPVELRFSTLAQKLKARKQHNAVSFKEAMESFQVYMKSDTPPVVKSFKAQTEDQEEGDAVASEIMALAAEEEQKELVRKVEQLLDQVNLMDVPPVSCGVRPSDSGIMMDVSTEMRQWEDPAFKGHKFNESAHVSVGVNTSFTCPDVEVCGAMTDVRHGGARPKTSSYGCKTNSGNGPMAVADASMASVTQLKKRFTNSHRDTMKGDKGMRLQGNSTGYGHPSYPNISGHQETSDLDETDTTEDSESDSSIDVASTGEQCQEYVTDEKYEGTRWYHDYEHQDSRTGDREYNQGESWENWNYTYNDNQNQAHDGSGQQQYNYQNGYEHYAGPSGNNNDVNYTASGIPANIQSNPYWVMAAWQYYYWMMACGATANPEQFYYQNYMAYSQYASHYRDLYQESKANKKLRNIHDAQKHYIDQLVKSLKDLNGQ